MESGLAAICIVRNNNEITQGPRGWFSHATVCGHGLTQMGNGHYFLSIARAEGQGCIAVGFGDTEIEELNREISLPRLLELLSDLPVIRSVRLK